MSWNKIDDYLLDRYCVEGEDKELSNLMEEHDREVRDNAVREFATWCMEHVDFRVELAREKERKEKEETRQRFATWCAEHGIAYNKAEEVIDEPFCDRIVKRFNEAC